jgi:thiamine transport system substrate-binding protein
MNENTTRYQDVIFPEGHATTIEGIGLTKSCKDVASSEAFIDYVLTDAQLDIAIANSMYPANTSIKLPDAYKWAPKPKKLSIDPQRVQDNLDKWLDNWTKAMVE